LRYGAEVEMGTYLRVTGDHPQEGNWVFVSGMSARDGGERVAVVYPRRGDTFRITIYDTEEYQVRKR
jgi:hypothetical protein